MSGQSLCVEVLERRQFLSSVNGAAMAPLLGGVTVNETGAGATRSVEVGDLYLISDPLHPRRFMKVQVTRP